MDFVPFRFKVGALVLPVQEVLSSALQQVIDLIGNDEGKANSGDKRFILLRGF